MKSIHWLHSENGCFDGVLICSYIVYTWKNINCFYDLMSFMIESGKFFLFLYSIFMEHSISNFESFDAGVFCKIPL
jgi:hypothetical protein